MKSWYSIRIPRNQFQLNATLLGGQSFRWQRIADDVEEYQGIFANILWKLKQTDDHLLYCVEKELPYEASKIRMKVDKPLLQNESKSETLYPESYYSNLLRVYFRLDEDLPKLYDTWCKAHNHFSQNTNKLYAVRMLAQDPVENLISFICSQNNHIKRISSMIENLCRLYGKPMGDGHFMFPDLEKLTGNDVEQRLRQQGFGYRAKYIQRASQQIIEKGGDDWFEELKSMNYHDAHKQLISLHGIGPKVADCICLMSLNHLSAVPVDTHIFQVAVNYLPHLKKVKNINKTIYNEVAEKFREIYGSYAGWAQTVLFCADLKQFNETNSDNICNASGSRKKAKLK